MELLLWVGGGCLAEGSIFPEDVVVCKIVDDFSARTRCLCRMQIEEKQELVRKRWFIWGGERAFLAHTTGVSIGVCGAVTFLNVMRAH